MNAVDYSFYTNRFGGRLSAEDFMRLLPYASAYLSHLSCGRTDGELSDALTERAHYALCALVDAYSLNEQGGGVAAETNDGISVTYVSSHCAKSEGQRLYEAAALFLSGTGLLFRGVRGC